MVIAGGDPFISSSSTDVKQTYFYANLAYLQA